MDLAALILNVGIFIATAGAAAVAWVQGAAAIRAEKRAIDARDEAVEALKAAKSQAIAARRQANAAEAAVDQVDRHRASDRQAEAMLALTAMLYREVELASNMDLWSRRAFLRFANGDQLVRAYALLPEQDHPVAHWATRRREDIVREVDLAQGEVANGRVGRRQAAAARIAAHSVDELLLWQRGERSVQSFIDDV